MRFETSKNDDLEIELNRNIDEEFQSCCGNYDLSADKSYCDNFQKCRHWTVREVSYIQN